MEMQSLNRPYLLSILYIAHDVKNITRLSVQIFDSTSSKTDVNTTQYNDNVNNKNRMLKNVLQTQKWETKITFMWQRGLGLMKKMMMVNVED